MKKLELVEKEKQTITLDQIDCDKHLVIYKPYGINAILRGNNESGYKFVFGDGTGKTFPSINDCFNANVHDYQQILIYEL